MKERNLKSLGGEKLIRWPDEETGPYIIPLKLRPRLQYILDKGELKKVEHKLTRIDNKECETASSLSAPSAKSPLPE